jgi:hypothetical protein
MTNRETAQMVADRIIELLDRGDLPPWEQPWKFSPLGDPRNALSMKPYRGVNRWLTLIAQSLGSHEDTRLHNAGNDQTAVSRTFQEDGSLHWIMQDMAQDLYLAPEALLAVPEDGQLTVADANRRLLAILLLTDRPFAKQTAREEIRDISPENAQALREVSVAVMDSRSHETLRTPATGWMAAPAATGATARLES